MKTRDELKAEAVALGIKVVKSDDVNSLAAKIAAAKTSSDEDDDDASSVSADAAALLKRVELAYATKRSSGIETVIEGDLATVATKIPKGTLLQAEIEKDKAGLVSSTRQFRLTGIHASDARDMTVKGVAGKSTAYYAETLDGRFAFVRVWAPEGKTFVPGTIVSLNAYEVPAGTHTLTINVKTNQARVTRWLNGGFIASQFGYESSEQELTLVAKILANVSSAKEEKVRP